MTRLRALGIRARVAGAMAAVALLSVVLSTVLSNIGLQSQISGSADARLRTTAAHIAEIAAGIYERSGSWTPAARTELAHFAAVDGLRIAVDDGRPSRGLVNTAPVVVAGRTIGTVTVRPINPQSFAEPDRDLHHRLNRLHLLAAGFAGLLALIVAALVAVPLARPLRRLTDGARQMQAGRLDTRVEPQGGAELQQLAGALNRLAATLEREEGLRKEATADLAHELRTPLQGILSRVEAAQDGVLPDSGANLAAVHAEALRLSRLVEDLGRLSEAQQPGMLVARDPLDLSDVVASRVDAQRTAFAEKHIALDDDLRPARLAGDANRLGQVVDNLLSNALRYTDAGGRVVARTFEQGEHAVLEVTDTGIGISPEDLPRIFERFWRSDKSRARTSGGAGIGLTIVQELVRAHDGRIDVNSRPGRGTTFSVRLPLLRG